MVYASVGFTPLASFGAWIVSFFDAENVRVMGTILRIEIHARYVPGCHLVDADIIPERQIVTARFL